MGLCRKVFLLSRRLKPGSRIPSAGVPSCVAETSKTYTNQIIECIYIYIYRYMMSLCACATVPPRVWQKLGRSAEGELLLHVLYPPLRIYSIVSLTLGFNIA